MKEFLHQHDVPFEGIDVGEHPDALERIREHTGGPIGTPAVVIDGEARIGFLPDWMAERLDLTATTG
ncbi:MAG: glutaredoxin domain-containing protein [Acidobacteriota bacterium]